MAPGATSPTIPRPVVFAGQQAYVDYRLGMVAKVDALDTLNPSTAAGVCGLVEYDGFASDRLISRTDLPAVAQSADARLTLRFHPGARAHGGKDSRFVPVPPAAALERIRADLRGAITLTARATPGFDASAARRRLDDVWDDYLYAHRHARHAGDFNVVWTIRTLRCLGYRSPVLAVGDLWDTPWMAGVIADTLVPLIQENGRFVAVANHAIAESGPADAGMSARPPGHVPLSLTDRATGTRFRLRVERRKGGLTLLGAGDVPSPTIWAKRGGMIFWHFLRSIEDVARRTSSRRSSCAGPGGGHPQRPGCHPVRVGDRPGRWSRSSASPPSQLPVRGRGPRRRPAGRGPGGGWAAPAGLEPTLLSRLLAVGPDQVRAEIAARCGDDPERGDDPQPGDHGRHRARRPVGAAGGRAPAALRLREHPQPRPPRRPRPRAWGSRSPG